ncbi:IS110 family transposase [Paenibacillus sabinae]|uniref:IS110 family transposase n=1 Tax=Paenibacillus sabinae TaxID=365617 RepID=UPI0030844286
MLGEAGDLSGYVHGNALLRHAGLNVSEASSGKWRGKMALSKRGRPRLRRFLFLMTMCMVMTNPNVRALHHYNVDVKKLKKMKSIMKLCGKVARMLVSLAKNNEAIVQLKYFRKPLGRVISPVDAFAGWTRSTEYREAINKRARTRSDMGVKIARGDMETCRIWNKLGDILSPLFLHALTGVPSHRLLCSLLI